MSIRWVLTLAIATSLVVGPTAVARPERTAAGTVVFISAQEPPNLQGPWAGNSLSVTAAVLNNIWYGCQIRDDKADFVPRLCVGRPRIVSSSPLVTVHEYKRSAVWSDGRPVTARDFRATWRVFTDPKNTVISRAGWEEIDSVRGNGKRTRVVWKRPYADWESVVSAGPYPEHVIRGKDMNEMFRSSIPVSSGPWLFGSWQRGVQLTLVKNRRFRAHTPMKLDSVVIRYIPDTNTGFQALRAREADLTVSLPQLQLASFMRDRNFVVGRGDSYSWEHVAIQFGPNGHPALKQRYVRKALITGINRAQIARVLFGQIAPGLQTLQSVVFMPFERTYEENWSKYRFSQREVIGLLKRNGCTGGPDVPAAGNDRIWTCPGVGRLSFRLTTTSENQARQLTFEVIQHQLKSVGIELVPRFGTAGTVFGTVIPSGDWDLALYTLVRNPSGEINTDQLYGCGGDVNFTRYCNPRLTALLQRVPATLGAGERARLLNEAEARYLVEDVPSIPLYATPRFLVRSAKLTGPVLNPTGQGPFWNVGAWAWAPS